ncbi:MAG: sulfite exporter TauE/SafE family protein, partial [Desulfovibrionaceae bacterium]|nr:sulfite exporter TauE/SafE family protein [Desulfovibrionaceae bacterium]
ASIPLLISYAAGQNKKVTPKDATIYALYFSLGLFFSIALLGLICFLAGTLLGEVPALIQALVGIFLIWVGFITLRRKHCEISYAPLFNLPFSGFLGALLLGLVYGFLAGVCTFGFLAPIIATLFVEHKVLQGLEMILCFGAGHCLPIILLGSGVSLTAKHGYKKLSTFLQKACAVLVMLFGLYFVVEAWPH